MKKLSYTLLVLLNLFSLIKLVFNNRQDNTMVTEEAGAVLKSIIGG